MATPKPKSFKVLREVLILTALVLLIGLILLVYHDWKIHHSDAKAFFILAPVLWITFAYSLAGISAGIRFKDSENSSDRLNRIGLVGNIIYFIAMAWLMLVGVLSIAG
jgi:hypothetical protein